MKNLKWTIQTPTFEFVLHCNISSLVGYEAHTAITHYVLQNLHNMIWSVIEVPRDLLRDEYEKHVL